MDSRTRPSETTGAGPEVSPVPEFVAEPAFGILGPLVVVHDGETLEVPSGKQQALLAALLLRPGEAVSAPTLMEQVWGGAADRTVLNVCVMRLRRTLRDRDHALIRAEGSGYRVAVTAAAVDLHRFRQLSTRAGEAGAGGDRQRERALLREALSLWRGEALAGIASPVLQAEVVPILEEERLAAVERRLDADLACGAHAELIGELRGLVADHPFRERFWCQLLLALYRSGRQSEALAAYLTARRQLTEALGIEPGEELRELHHRILGSDPALAAPAPGAESRPRVIPAQLPSGSTGFSGRAEQLDRLDRLLDDAEPAPATLIVGPPGVGKTALAVYWASRHREHWPDGQLYLDLRGYGPAAELRPIEALAYFLLAIGVPAEQVPGDTSQASALFRSLVADRKLLLLLDNASTTEQVRPLLPGGDDCTVIVTSRDRLTGLIVKEGARQLRLDVLADAEARSLLADAVGTERLLAELDAVDELARLCGNLPLALRIVAADLTGHPQRSLAKHVAGLRSGNRLDALQVAEDDGTAVRAAFRASYSRMPEPVRRLFRLLGLFPGSEIGVDAAAALAGLDTAETGRLLDRLVSAHLVASRGPDRFVLHDLLRLFAAELAHEEGSETDRVSALPRLYDHYVLTARAASELLYSYNLDLPSDREPACEPIGFDDEVAAADWLETERPNLIAVIRYAAERGDSLDACRLSAAVHHYLKVKVYLVDMLTAARVGLSAAHALDSPRALAVAHLALAGLHHCQNQLRAVAKHLEQALGFSQHDDWQEGQAIAHNNLSGVYALSGRLDLTTDHLYRALKLSRRARMTLDEAMIRSNLTKILVQMGHDTEAITHIERAERIYGRLGSRVTVARGLANLGSSLAELGELDRARTVLQGAAARQTELDDRLALPDTLDRLAKVHLDLGELARATELAAIALAQARETGYRRSETGPHLIFAAVDRCNGRHDSAIERYDVALRLAVEVGDRYRQVQALAELGEVYAELGRRGPARHHLGRAAAIARRTGLKKWERRITDSIAGLP